MSSSPEPKSNEESSGDGRHQAQDDLSTITERLNDVQKFSEEWFQLKEQEVALRNEIVMADDEGSLDTELKPPADTEHVNTHDGPNYSLNEAPLGVNNAGELFEGGPEIIQEISGPINPTLFDQSARDEKKQPGAKNITVPTNTPGELEIIQETSGPVNPTSFDQSAGDEKKQSGSGAKNIPVPIHARVGLEIIQQDNGPAAPMSLQQIDNGAKIPDKARTNHHEGPEIFQDVDGPDPPASLEQTIVDKINQNDEERSGIVDNCDESISYPSRNDIEEGTLQNEDTWRNREGNTQVFGISTQNDIAPTPTPIEEAVNLAEVEGRTIEAHDSLPNITEAYLVDDGSVVMATPKVPWWKQRRTKILLGCVLISIVTVLAVSLKFTLAPGTVTQFVTTTASPTNSLVPSSQPTSAPSFSQMPSMAPSACSNKVITNTRKIDLLSSDLSDSRAAVDGDNLVIVSTQLPGGMMWTGGSFYIAFYSRSRGGDDWVLNGYSIESTNTFWNVNFAFYGVALSGRKALIGLPVKNTVYAFVLSDAGLWVKVPFPSPTKLVSSCGGFGHGVYMCDDLVVISDQPDDWYTHDGHKHLDYSMYFFKEIGDQWVEIGIEHNFDDDAISKILAEHSMQDKFPICWGTSTLLYSAARERGGVSIYQMDKNTSTTYQHPHYNRYDNEWGVSAKGFSAATTVSKHIQTLSSSVYGKEFGKWHGITMSEDLLVVGSLEHTHVFARKDGSEEWEEVLRFEQSYEHYVLSGRTLIASDDWNDSGEVYAMIIADCTPEMIIQDLPPENCYEMNVSIYNRYENDDDKLIDVEDECNPDFSPWMMLLMTSGFLEADSAVVKLWDCNHAYSTVCLNEGWYRSLFYPYYSYGCYNISFVFPASEDGSFELNGCVDGRVSSDGGVLSDEVYFDIPRTTVRTPPTPSPTISSPPSTSLSPTQYPTITPSPTTWPPTYSAYLYEYSDQPTYSPTTQPTYPGKTPSPTVSSPPTQYPTITPYPTKSFPTTFPTYFRSHWPTYSWTTEPTSPDNT